MHFNNIFNQKHNKQMMMIKQIDREQNLKDTAVKVQWSSLLLDRHWSPFNSTEHTGGSLHSLILRQHCSDLLSLQCDLLRQPKSIRCGCTFSLLQVKIVYWWSDLKYDFLSFSLFFCIRFIHTNRHGRGEIQQAPKFTQFTIQTAPVQ